MGFRGLVNGFENEENEERARWCCFGCVWKDVVLTDLHFSANRRAQSVKKKAPKRQSLFFLDVDSITEEDVKN